MHNIFFNCRARLEKPSSYLQITLAGILGKEISLEITLESLGSPEKECQEFGSLLSSSLLPPGQRSEREKEEEEEETRRNRGEFGIIPRYHPEPAAWTSLGRQKKKHKAFAEKNARLDQHVEACPDCCANYWGGPSVAPPLCPVLRIV